MISNQISHQIAFLTPTIALTIERWAHLYNKFIPINGSLRFILLKTIFLKKTVHTWFRVVKNQTKLTSKTNFTLTPQTEKQNVCIVCCQLCFLYQRQNSNLRLTLVSWENYRYIKQCLVTKRHCTLNKDVILFYAKLPLAVQN